MLCLFDEFYDENVELILICLAKYFNLEASSLRGFEASN